MISSLSRKIRQIFADPVLRHWLIGRALGRWPGGPAFTAHRPPYLSEMLPLATEAASEGVGKFAEISDVLPSGSLELELAGKTLTVEPGGEEALYERAFDDIETLLSLHRFAWILSLKDDTDPAWINLLWKAWRVRFGTPDSSWPWHPYTAGERAVNLITYAERHGLPGPAADTVQVLAAHAPAIIERLEYFGDHNTSNHLANNGRALLVLGRTFGMNNTAAIGERILTEEASRIFTPSGILREGSSHYHLLLTRLYEEAAIYSEALVPVARKARNVAEALLLPGGLPLIGDISPDISPDGLLSQLALETGKGNRELAGDGWLRMDTGKWSGLWHASPDGFAHMPGHGHQDTGSFELHFNDEAVIIDPGRGAYGDSGDAALYRSAALHNGLTIDGTDPFPPNKPYYNKAFCSAITGSTPVLEATESGVRIDWKDRHREWQFNGDRHEIVDLVDGTGLHRVTRTLITPLDVELTESGVLLSGCRKSYQLCCTDGDISVRPVMRWRAYGQSDAAHAITFNKVVALPFAGRITLEAL